MELAAKDFLLDGGTNNRSIVEQTFEIMARMKLDPKIYYKIDGGKLYLWLTPVYDLYTRYRKDYAVAGEVLTYSFSIPSISSQATSRNASARKTVSAGSSTTSFCVKTATFRDLISQKLNR